MQKDQKSAGCQSQLGLDPAIVTQDNFQCVNGIIQIKKTDTVDLEYQVAGHSRVGLLTHKLGYCLKPVQKEPLGSREIALYRTIVKHYKHKQDQLDSPTATDPSCDKESSQEDCLDLLGQVVPKFYGVAVIVDESGAGEGDSSSTSSGLEQFLVLDNIVQGFQSPSIVDLKIGEQTWSPDATEAKIKHEKSKYIGTKSQLGISVTGMHYYDLTTDTAVRCPDGFGKSLTIESIYTVLRQFLNAASGLDKLIAQLILDKLQPIQKLFSTQRMYNFYSSSILVAYDAKYVADYLKMNNNENGVSASCPGPTSLSHLETLRKVRDTWLRVWMIDFAHVHPNPTGNDLDLNYIYGLDNLVTILRNIVNEDGQHTPTPMS